MSPRTAKRLAGAFVAGLTLTLVASVAPASAAPPSPGSVKLDGVVVVKKDSGWG